MVNWNAEDCGHSNGGYVTSLEKRRGFEGRSPLEHEFVGDDEPCVMLLPSTPGEKTRRAAFGYVFTRDDLIGYANDENGGESHNGDRHVWIRKILAGLLIANENAFFEVRYVTFPANKNRLSSTGIFILGFGCGKTEGRAKAEAKKLVANMDILLKPDKSVWKINAITDEHCLQGVLQPFSPRWGAEIRRQQDDYKLISSKAVGFGCAPNGENKAIVSLPKAVDGGTTSMQAFFNILGALDAYCMVSVVFRPRSLERSDAELISSAKEALGSNGGYRIAASTPAGVKALDTAKLQILDKKLTALPEVLHKHYEIRCVVLGNGQLRSSIINVIGDELFGGRPEYWTYNRLSRAEIEEFQKKPGHTFFQRGVTDAFSHKYALGEAAYMFRLPECEESMESLVLPVDPGPRNGTIIGKVRKNRHDHTIRVAPEDRMRHLYLCGQTGTGKSTLLLSMILQDIKDGKGLGLIDPHGDLCNHVLEHMPPRRMKNVVLLDAGDWDNPVGLNLLECKATDYIHQDFIVQHMFSMFRKLIPDQSMIGPMFETYMRNALMLAMSDPGEVGTLLDIPRIFTDKEFCRQKLSRCENYMVKMWWEKEYRAQSDFHKSEMLMYVLSKLNSFIESPIMRNILGQKKSSLDITKLMDSGQIFLANLERGSLGEYNSSLLGLILTSQIEWAALQRVNSPAGERRPFNLYIDEVQNFATKYLTNMLSESRKYGISLCLANQYTSQLQGERSGNLLDSIFGNAGTLVFFRLGHKDASTLQSYIGKSFSPQVMSNLPNFTAVARLLSEGRPLPLLTMETFPPPRKGSPERALKWKQENAEKHGRKKAAVEEEISERLLAAIGEKAA